MEEFKWENGDLVPDGAGGFCRVTGSDALIRRVLFKLTARRGALPLLPELGSRLFTLSREKPSDRQALCARYVTEALEQEDVTVTDVLYEPAPDGARVKVYLQWQGRPLEITARLEG